MCINEYCWFLLLVPHFILRTESTSEVRKWCLAAMWIQPNAALSKSAYVLGVYGRQYISKQSLSTPRYWKPITRAHCTTCTTRPPDPYSIETDKQYCIKRIFRKMTCECSNIPSDTSIWFWSFIDSIPFARNSYSISPKATRYI